MPATSGSENSLPGAQVRRETTCSDNGERRFHCSRVMVKTNTPGYGVWKGYAEAAENQKSGQQGNADRHAACVSRAHHRLEPFRSMESESLHSGAQRTHHALAPDASFSLFQPLPPHPPHLNQPLSLPPFLNQHPSPSNCPPPSSPRSANHLPHLDSLASTAAL